MGALDFLDDELNGLAHRGLLRSYTDVAPNLIQLCSNDYLGYGRMEFAAGAVRSGASASRLICGELEAHRAAEAALAEWVGKEAALLFSSGYAANVGTISALVGPGDLVVSDELNHASIIDGCRLSRAEVAVVPHLAVAEVAKALEASKARRKLVVTEAYFSMDGDFADLPQLASACQKYGAILMVDEAHSMGVFGAEGSGLCRRTGAQVDVLVGPLGKAVGLAGAFVAGCVALRQWLWNRARSFVFSTAVLPALAAAIPARVKAIRGDDAARERVTRYSQRLAASIGSSRVGPIFPVVVGSSARALELSATLAKGGVSALAIRPPTVPVGMSRLRLAVTAALEDEELDRACAVLRASLG